MSGKFIIIVGTIFLVLLLNVLILVHSYEPLPHVIEEYSEVGKSKKSILTNYNSLPLYFEENRGQVDSQVKFLSRGNGYGVFLAPTETILVLNKISANQRLIGIESKLEKPPIAKRSVVRLKLIGGNLNTSIQGVNELPGKVNYLKGRSKRDWIKNLSTYSKVKYSDIYPEIDLIYYSKQTKLEYDFIVAPGGDPNVIKFSVHGVDRMQLNSNEHLVLYVPEGEIVLQKPLIYQEVNGEKQSIPSHYSIDIENKIVAFRVGKYNPENILIIDPVLNYSTYLGGTSSDFGQGVAIDSSGNAYVTGYTISLDFPTNPGDFQTMNVGNIDAFVTKINANGSGLIYSTYLGGSNDDFGRAIVVDSSGNAYITGETTCVSLTFPPCSIEDFPTTPGAIQTTFGGGFGDAFVTKINSSGNDLSYSTYLGGSGVFNSINGDKGSGIDLDSSGNIYVTGLTDSADFPTTPGAIQTTFGGGFGDAFVTKINSSGNDLSYSTYLGGSDFDFGRGLSRDSFDNIYISGNTFSNDFPTSSGAFDIVFNNSADVFITKLNNTGTDIFYSTYVGGSSSDAITAIAVDPSGNAYITGSTASSDFPISSGAFDISYGGGSGCSFSGDAFVAKLNSTGTDLAYSTYLGGSNDDGAFGIAVDPSGNAYVTGGTRSVDFPTTPDAFQDAFAGGGGCGFLGDAFVTKLNNVGTDLDYSTFLGGSNNSLEEGFGIVLDSMSDIYIVGITDSTDFPTTPGAYQTILKGGGNLDVFITKFSDDSDNIEGPPGDPTCNDAIDNDNDGNTDSSDTGCAWQKTNGPWNTVCDTSFSTIAIHPNNPDILYIGNSHLRNGCGVYKSTDGGQRWIPINIGLPKVGIRRFKHYPTISKVVISPSDPNILYAGTFEVTGLKLSGRIFRSNNGGRTWTDASGKRSIFFFQKQINKAVLDIVVDPQYSNVVYVSVVGDGVFRTTDGGNNWNRIRKGTIVIGATDYYTTIEVAKSNPNSVYISGYTRYEGSSIPCSLSTQHCLEVNGVIPLGPFKSFNRGQNWTSINNPTPPLSGLNLAALITDLIVDPLDQNHIYVSTMTHKEPLIPFPSNNKGIFESIDGGISWQTINNDIDVDLTKFPIYKLSLDQYTYNDLYALAGFEGIFITIDNGSNWDQTTILGLPFSTFIVDLGLTDQSIFALTTEGIYIIDQFF